MTLPTIDTDGKFTRVSLENFDLWFSYKTLIAFQVDGQARVVCENVWTVTTGKHLNTIDGGTTDAKKRRLSHAEFEKAAESISLLPIRRRK